MTPSGMKIHAPIVVSLALLLAACGPTRPPPDVLGNAPQRLASARSADAQTYAPLELRFAEDKLRQARLASQDGDFKEASALAEESSVNSELAMTKAKLGKLRESVDDLKQENAEIERVLSSSEGSYGESP
ncbi:DUF4398 domain-containing protein [Dokdonella sp.]|uniref:DUF4398 domain-containing protein n=1 Tax=Dokdonella sp. TaxID=2291710 RepID=UPI003C3BA572